MRGLTIGAVKFEIPDWLDARDDDGTLVAYPRATDYANVRAIRNLCYPCNPWLRNCKRAA